MDEPCVRHLRLLLEPDQATEERLLLGAPEAAVEVDEQRAATGELGEAARIPPLVGKLEVREPGAGGPARRRSSPSGSCRDACLADRVGPAPPAGDAANRQVADPGGQPGIDTECVAFRLQTKHDA